MAAPSSLVAVGCLGVVLLLSGCWSQSSHCNHSPAIYIEGVYVLGVNKSITCVLLAPNSTQNDVFQWTINSVPQPFEVLQNDYIGSDVIRKIRLHRVIEINDNRQSFVCSVQFSDKTCSDSVVVSTLYVGPGQAIIDGPNTVLAGSSYNWTCFSEESSGAPPSVTWRFKGNDTRINSRLYTTTETPYTNPANGLLSYNVSSVLTLPISAGSPDFSLLCRFDQPNTGIQSRPATQNIVLIYPPQVTTPLTSYTGTIATQLTLLVNAVASPSVTRVRWFKDGALLDTTTARYITSGANLTILSLQKSDTANYICEVFNTQGSVNSSVISLTVRYAPTIKSATPVGGVLGSELELSCLIDAVPAYTTVLWYKVSLTGRDDEIFPQRDPAKYSGGTASSTPNLTILGLTASDAGRYKCAADNNVGRGEGDNILVEIYYKPQINVTGALTRNEMQSVTLKCDVSAYPAMTSVVWYKAGQVLNVSDVTRYSGGTLASPGLTVLSLTPSDAGVYYCVASNPVGSTSSNSTALTVNYVPVITVAVSELSRTEGQSVTLPVVVSSSPPLLSVEWRHLAPGADTEVTLNMTSQSGGYSGGTVATPSLTMSSVTAAHTGTYTVMAINAMGNSTASINLVVSHTPSTPNVTTPAEGGYVEGQTITLTCGTSSYPPAEYRWYKAGQLVATGSTLTIASAGPLDNGVYTCEAYNTVGSQDSNVTVVVLYKPRAGTISNVTSAAGQTAILTCAVNANPPATSYSWTKGESTLTSASPSRTLTVAVTSSSFGEYQCRATNTQGSSDPISIFLIDTKDGDDGGTTGQSTESTGLSTATLILIIIICLIILIVIILIIIFCCATGRCACKKKDNNVSPHTSTSDMIPPPIIPASEKPLPALTVSANGTVSARAAPPVSHSSNGGPRASSTSTPATTANYMDPEDHTLSPSMRNGPLGHGLSISVPGQNKPRPHHLPPLGMDGMSEETESARDNKPKKKKRRRRPPNPDEETTASEHLEV